MVRSARLIRIQSWVFFRFARLRYWYLSTDSQTVQIAPPLAEPLRFKDPRERWYSGKGYTGMRRLRLQVYIWGGGRSISGADLSAVCAIRTASRSTCCSSLQLPHIQQKRKKESPVFVCLISVPPSFSDFILQFLFNAAQNHFQGSVRR